MRCSESDSRTDLPQPILDVNTIPTILCSESDSRIHLLHLLPLNFVSLPLCGYHGLKGILPLSQDTECLSKLPCLHTELVTVSRFQ